MGKKIISCVYALIDPRCNSVKYIGRTSHLQQRITSHFGLGCRSVNPEKYDWIKNLKEAGLHPEVKVIKECFEDDDIKRIESIEILKAIKMGHVLFNINIPNQNDFRFYFDGSKIRSYAIITEESANLLIDFIKSNTEYLTKI